MKTVVGVNFRHQGKVYYFDPNGEKLSRGTGVIVETAQGVEFATVVLSTRDVEDEKIVGELKSIVRVATGDDYDQLKLNQKNEKDAIKICKEKIFAHELEMKLISAEYAFDRSKLTFFFTADGRVDFRELVKDLASVFRTRIELRQVGVRDETRLLGGIGVCGRPLCCATWLPDFVPVSIKMAKEQNLSLNSAKISGVCGRLMCCLKNEAETYEYLNAQLPHIGAVVKTIEGITGTVKAVDVLRQKVSVMIGDEQDDDKEIRDYRVEEISFTPRKKKENKNVQEEQPDEELAKLEESEEKENKETNKHQNHKKNFRDRKEKKENRGEQEGAENAEAREGGMKNEGREKREKREPRENREGREKREKREPRENREGRENRNERENRGERENRETRENRTENAEAAVNPENREAREHKEHKNYKGHKNHKNFHKKDRGPKEGKDQKPQTENRE